jgi:hypothetical protein
LIGETGELAGKGSAIHEDVWKQWQEECYEAMEQEIEVKNLFKAKFRAAPHAHTRPTKEELQQQSKWVVEEMGPDRDFKAVSDKSWIWQMYCLLSKERRLLTMYKEYEAFMLGAVKRFEKRAHEQAQALMIARIVDISTANRVATSHGPVEVLVSEVIDVEADDSSAPLGEDVFSPLRFFSRSEDKDLGDEVDYDSDSQKGTESPFAMQLAFSSPLTLDKDLSACMALLRNSPMTKNTESSLNFAGTGEVQAGGRTRATGQSLVMPMFKWNKIN